MMVGLISEDGSMDSIDLADYAQANLEQVLARVPGVGEVETFSTQYAMRVWLNPDKLNNFHLTMDDVIQELQAYNVEVSAGQFGGAPAVPGQRLNASIIVQSLLKTPEEFAAIPLRVNPDGSIVRVRDVGRTELGTERYENSVLFNGKPASALAVRQAPGANALDTADAIKAKMKELSRYFPHGMKAIYPYDTTPFVKVSINEVVKTLVEAIILVFLVMYLFLGSFRATLIPTLAVPVVLLGTFANPGAVRVFHQHAHHVRYGAGHRPSGGRRHRGGGKRRAHHERGGAPAPGGDPQVHGGNHQRPDRHRPGAVGGLRPHGLLRRLHRGHLPPVFHYHHRRHAPVGGGGPDPDPGALRLPLKPVTKGHDPAETGFSLLRPFFLWFDRGFFRIRDWYRDTVCAASFGKKLRYLLVYLVLVVTMGCLFVRMPTAYLPQEDQGVMYIQAMLPAGSTMEQTQQVLDEVRSYFLKDEKEAVEAVLYGGRPGLFRGRAEYRAGVCHAQGLAPAPRGRT